MINKDELISLTWEQKMRFKQAIKQGWLDKLEDNPREWKHSLVGALLWKYPTRSSTLNKIKAIVGEYPTWESMTDDVIKDFVDECVDSGLSLSSVKTFCAELKSVLNSNKRKIPSTDFMKILSVKGTASQAVYLTESEISAIINYTAVGDVEKLVRRNFIVECLTGARRCDAELLTMENCNIETGTISYVPDKTPDVVVTVPIDERRGLRKFLSERLEVYDCSLATFNNVIRNICKACNINTPCTIHRRGKSVTAPKYELVSSHTARRSFATNLYLAGVSLEDIAILMGHGKNIDTTKRYICAERDMASNVMAYFQPQT